MRELASARSDTVMESPGWYWALVLSGDVLHPRNTLPTGAVKPSPEATRACTDRSYEDSSETVPVPPFAA